MPGKILCPVDFSGLSALALRYAALLAGCQHAEMTVLYANAFFPPPYFTSAQVAEFERQFRESFGAAEEELKRFALGALPPGSEAPAFRVVEASPADGIVDVADEIGADVIVMGTHGRSGMNRLLLGSVAELVLRASRIPVLTVRGEPGKAAPVKLKNILCPVNDSLAAKQAVSFAARLAVCAGATVTAVHVKEPSAKAPIPNLCNWLNEQEHAACKIQEVTREGDPAEQIVALAGQLSCDMLVIGSRHRPFFDSTVLGVTTARVVRHAPCPVLTVVERAEGAKA